MNLFCHLRVRDSAPYQEGLLPHVTGIRANENGSGENNANRN